MNWSEKLLELEGKATPSGWEVDPSGVGNTDIVYRRPHQIGGAYGFFTDNESDAALIVHLRNRAKEIAALVEAVEKIAAHDPNVENGGEGFNEWGEAWCFQHVQEIARKALAAMEGESK